METHLNRFGLIAIKLNEEFTIDSISKKLEITLLPKVIHKIVDAIQGDLDSIGLYNDVLLLSVIDIFTFFEKSLEGFPYKLLTTFQTHEICVVYYYSIPDMWGFRLFENGESVRVKLEEMEKVLINIGHPIDIENNSSSQTDILNWIVRKVTGEKLTELIGKEILLMKFVKPDRQLSYDF